jgi:hypothetical protein
MLKNTLNVRDFCSAEDDEKPFTLRLLCKNDSLLSNSEPWTFQWKSDEDYLLWRRFLEQAGLNNERKSEEAPEASTADLDGKASEIVRDAAVAVADKAPKSPAARSSRRSSFTSSAEYMREASVSVSSDLCKTWNLRVAVLNIASGSLQLFAEKSGYGNCVQTIVLYDLS